MNIWLCFSHLDCNAVASWLGSMLTSVAEAMETNAGVWDAYDVFHAQDMHLYGPSGAKRCRYDHGFVEAMVNASEPSLNDTCIARIFDQRMLHEWRPASWLTFAKTHSVHACWDGVRIGNPAREFLDVVIVNARLQQSTMCCPQVLFCFSLVDRVLAALRFQKSSAERTRLFFIP
jgi:hypothetical protein